MPRLPARPKTGRIALRDAAAPEVVGRHVGDLLRSAGALDRHGRLGEEGGAGLEVPHQLQVGVVGVLDLLPELLGLAQEVDELLDLAIDGSDEADELLAWILDADDAEGSSLSQKRDEQDEKGDIDRISPRFHGAFNLRHIGFIGERACAGKAADFFHFGRGGRRCVERVAGLDVQRSQGGGGQHQRESHDAPK